MEERVELRATDPELMREFSENLSRELPLKQETRKHVGSMNEVRELELNSGEKVQVDIDPIASIPAHLF